MKNFNRAIAILLILCASSFAQELNLNVKSQEEQNFQHYQRRFEHYNKMKNWGIGLTFSGLVATTVGSCIFANGGGGDNSTGLEPVGIVSFFAGTYMLGAGLPLLICGRIRSKRYQKMLPSSVYMTPQSVQFSWEFF